VQCWGGGGGGSYGTTYGAGGGGGGAYAETPNVLVADTFNTYILNLADIADTSKNNVDKIIVSIANADALNTIYIDNIEVAQASDVFGIIT
jgi:hypothetical protein